MTVALERPIRPDVARPAATRARAGFLRDLDEPRQLLAHVTPTWFASVMGTGIVAVAAASLPVRFPGLHTLGVAVWAAAAVLLVGLSVLTAAHWIAHREAARRHHRDPVMAHFYGAPPMAMLTVGAGTLVLGKDVIGSTAAVGVDWALWLVGTVTGLVTAVAVPYLQFTRPAGVDAHRPCGPWLMSVVPPMVSASTGALLVPHTPAGQLRLTLVVSCYAMFGLALIASLVITTLIWYQLAMHGPGEARTVPTLWIVLGPVGQSITAANLLGGVAGQALPRPYSTALQAFGVVYGVPAWGFAALWACLVGAVTVRTARRRLPFSLAWWSFTFPVGTCVLGTTQLALHTGSVMLRWAAALIYLGLVCAWLVVGVRTARGAYRGTLFRPAGPVTA